jgi:hypothetical protein
LDLIKINANSTAVGANFRAQKHIIIIIIIIIIGVVINEGKFVPLLN